MALIRYRHPLQQDLDRLFGTFFDSHTAQERAPRQWVPAVDLVDEGDHYALSADIPGVSEQDVTIEVEDNVLRISGERKSERKESQEGYYRYERASGAFSRSLRLPEGTDPQAIEATIEQGVLRVKVPKPAVLAPHKVEVKAA
jgi:HSP20 family protein